MTTSARTGNRHKSYFEASRSPRYSLLFALPLLLAYEALAATTGSSESTQQVRNGAEVMLRELAFAVGGGYGPTVLMAGIIGLSVLFVWRDIRRTGERPRPSIFAGMTVESICLALGFGFVIGIVTAQLLGSLHLLAIGASPIERLSWQSRLMLSLGAGLYEELLFRVLLVSALAVSARVVLGWSRRGAGAFAAIVGALIFSAFHYVGPFGDHFQIQSFAFRAFSGLAFSGLYLLRGFGITAWTHALYDAFLLL